MATQTRQVWSGRDKAGNQAVIIMTYDDAQLRIDSFEIQNPTNGVLDISVTSHANGKNYAGTIQPNTASAVINMTPGAQNRLDITITPSGKIDGIEYEIRLIDQTVI